MIRTFQIDNIYENGTEIKSTVEIDIPADATEQQINDLVWAETGTGDPRLMDLDATYYAKTIDGIRPRIQLEFS